ncbi:hypothetical protein LguiA_022702 [Lonicera macranthoides]
MGPSKIRGLRQEPVGAHLRESQKIQEKRKAMDDAEEYPGERNPKKQSRTKAPPPGFVQYLDNCWKKYTIFPGTEANTIATNAINQWEKLSKPEKAIFESMAEDEKLKSEVVEAAIAYFGNRPYDVGSEDSGSEDSESEGFKPRWISGVYVLHFSVEWNCSENDGSMALLLLNRASKSISALRNGTLACALRPSINSSTASCFHPSAAATSDLRCFVPCIAVWIFESELCTLESAMAVVSYFLMQASKMKDVCDALAFGSALLFGCDARYCYVIRICFVAAV